MWLVKKGKHVLKSAIKLNRNYSGKNNKNTKNKKLYDKQNTKKIQFQCKTVKI